MLLLLLLLLFFQKKKVNLMGSFYNQSPPLLLAQDLRCIAQVVGHVRHPRASRRVSSYFFLKKKRPMGP